MAALCPRGHLLTSAMSLILCSMSVGWSPTGTRVMPGRSTRVMVLTGEGGAQWFRGYRIVIPTGVTGCAAEVTRGGSVLSFSVPQFLSRECAHVSEGEPLTGRWG